MTRPWYLTDWDRLAGIPEIQPVEKNAMSYIEPKPLSQYPFWLRWFFIRQERKYGRTLSPSWLWGRHPKLFAGMLGMLSIFQAKSYPIGTPLRSLISVRIAQLNGCAFCVDLSSYNMLKAAGSAEKAEKISSWREETIYSAKERAALEWAEMMTDSPGCSTSRRIVSAIAGTFFGWASRTWQ